MLVLVDGAEIYDPFHVRAGRSRHPADDAVEIVGKMRHCEAARCDDDLLEGHRGCVERGSVRTIIALVTTSSL